MIPDGWKLTSLFEVCEGQLQTGPFGSQLHAHEYKDNGIPVLMPKNLVKYRADTEAAAKIPTERAKDLSKHKLKIGDLLFSRRGDVARFALIDKDSEGALCGTGCLKATPSEKHSSLFLSYFLQRNTVKQWLEQNAVGQTMPNMNTAILSKLPLMAAETREEEEKIANILSTWDKAIETVEKLIDNSRTQKQALMQQLLTGKKRLPGFDLKWNGHSLGDLGKTYNGLTGKTKDDFLEGKPFIPYINIFNNDRIDTKKLNLVSIKKNEKQSKAIFGDIFFTTSSETPDEVGMSSVLLDEIEELYLNSFCFGFRLKDFNTLIPEYACYLLRSQSVRREICKLAQGSTRYNLSKPGLMKINLRLPPVDEQKLIVQILNNAGDDIKNLESNRDFLASEKKSLMQQLLTGKRRVKIDTAA